MLYVIPPLTTKPHLTYLKLLHNVVARLIDMRPINGGPSNLVFVQAKSGFCFIR